MSKEFFFNLYYYILKKYIVIIVRVDITCGKLKYVLYLQQTPCGKPVENSP
jgi:hypothetical protein